MDIFNRGINTYVEIEVLELIRRGRPWEEK